MHSPGLSPAVSSNINNAVGSDADTPDAQAGQMEEGSTNANERTRKEEVKEEKKISCSTCREAKVSLMMLLLPAEDPHLTSSCPSGQVYNRSVRNQMPQMPQV